MQNIGFVLVFLANGLDRAKLAVRNIAGEFLFTLLHDPCQTLTAQFSHILSARCSGVLHRLFCLDAAEQRFRQEQHLSEPFCAAQTQSALLDGGKMFLIRRCTIKADFEQAACIVHADGRCVAFPLTVKAAVFGDRSAAEFGCYACHTEVFREHIPVDTARLTALVCHAERRQREHIKYLVITVTLHAAVSAVRRSITGFNAHAAFAHAIITVGTDPDRTAQHLCQLRCNGCIIEQNVAVKPLSCVNTACLKDICLVSAALNALTAAGPRVPIVQYAVFNRAERTDIGTFGAFGNFAVL